MSSVNLCRHFSFFKENRYSTNAAPYKFAAIPNWSCGDEHGLSRLANRSQYARMFEHYREGAVLQEITTNLRDKGTDESSFIHRASVNTDEINAVVLSDNYADLDNSPPLHVYNTIMSMGRFRTCLLVTPTVSEQNTPTVNPVWSGRDENDLSQPAIICRPVKFGITRKGSFLMGKKYDLLVLLDHEWGLQFEKRQPHIKRASINKTVEIYNLVRDSKIQVVWNHHHSILIKQSIQALNKCLLDEPNKGGDGKECLSLPTIRSRHVWGVQSQMVTDTLPSVGQRGKALLRRVSQRLFQRALVNTTDEINALASGGKLLASKLTHRLSFYIPQNCINIYKCPLSQVLAKCLFVLGIATSSAAMAKDTTAGETFTRFSSSDNTNSSNSFSQEQLADMYGLDMTQWKEYQTVLKGPRGLWSPNIHPLMALGMRKGISKGEKKKLAKQYATVRFERIQREMAFERVVIEEGLKMYGHIPLFRDDFATGKSVSHVIDNPSDGVNYFVKPICSQCEAPIQEWISDGRKLNIFIAGNKSEITTFAKKMGISPLLVPSQITLNAMSESEMLSLGITKLPTVKYFQASK